MTSWVKVVRRAAALVLTCAPTVCCLAADAPTDAARETADHQIAALIEQLGDPQFAIRQRAQQQLVKLGFAAFDALAEAENNDDPEIAMQAGYLVRQIRAEWTREGDPRNIQQIFKDYDNKSDEGRLQRIHQLADLPHDGGLEWLCKLVRFEKSPLLSKQAALAIINQPAPTDPAAWARRAATIAKGIEFGRRPAARWLLAYVQAQSDPAGALAKWSELAETERRMLEEHPLETNRAIVAELLRRKIDLLDRVGRADEAVEVMRQIVGCERGDSDSLVELIEWLVGRKAWTVLDDVEARFAGNFDIDATLMHALAEARFAQGNQQLAQQSVERALKISGDNPQEHAGVAERLSDRGMVMSAEREWRAIMAKGPIGSPLDVDSRHFLAGSLHDRLEDLEAAKVLKELFDAADADPAIMQRIRTRQTSELNPKIIRSMMYFYFSADAGNRKDAKQQRELLEKALEQDRTNVDALIAMHHLTADDPARRADVVKAIHESIEFCRGRIEENPEEPTYYNQIAWLVANTEGDFDEAVRLAQKAVETGRADGMAPRRLGGLLDTLGHCYFAKKDYENAVKYQTEAAKLDPRAAAINRQLKVFQEALNRQKQGGR